MELYTKPLRTLSALKQRYPEMKTSHLKEALEIGLVTDADGKKLKKGAPTNGDLQVTQFEIFLSELQTPNFFPDIPIIKEEEEDWWVIDKPAGIPSHPNCLRDKTTITHWAFSRFPWIRNEFPDVQPTITPHRLDTGTSGLLIVAKNQQGYAYWREQFRHKKVTKTYLAWCWGVPREARFTVEIKLANHGKRVIESEDGKKTRSDIRVLDQKEGCFLCEVTTQTGFTHQVRVHLAYLGYPLLGDSLYDSQKREQQFPYHRLRATRIACSLHTYALTGEFVPVC